MQDGRAKNVRWSSKSKKTLAGRAEKRKMIAHKQKKCQVVKQKFARWPSKKMQWRSRSVAPFGGGGTKALTLSRFLSRATFLKTFLGFGRFSAKGVQKHHAIFFTVCFGTLDLSLSSPERHQPVTY
jgi:hypothetical protein